MTTPQFSYQYNNNANRWTNPVTGRFVAESEVVAEMRTHQTATYTALDNLTSDLYARNINLAQWQVAVAQELKDAHLAQAMFGAGGRANMSPTEWGRVGGTLANEYGFLTNFANDIANGTVSEAKALARIKQYGNATQQSYWREYASQSENLLYWLLASVRNCPDCIDLALNSPYTTDSIPTYPSAGVTRCHGNCKCTLVRRVTTAPELLAQNQRIINDMGVSDNET